MYSTYLHYYTLHSDSKLIEVTYCQNLSFRLMCMQSALYTNALYGKYECCSWKEVSYDLFPHCI